MKCTYCKSSIKKTEIFCSNCGKQYLPTKTKKSSSSSKILIVIGMLCILIGVGGHFYLKSINSPIQTVQRMYNALMNNSEVDFYNALKVSRSDIENRKEFMEYIKNQDMKTFLTALNENAEKVQKDGITKIILHEDGKEILRMNRVKVLGLYSKVELVPISEDRVAETEELALHEKDKVHVPVEKLKSKSFYTTTLQNGKSFVNLFVIPKDMLITELEFTSVLGEEGNFQYEGNFAFFLAEIDGENGVLQDHLSISEEQLIINKQLQPFTENKLNDKTIVSLKQVEASNYSTVNMWMYAEGELKEIAFNEGISVGISSNSFKFIGEQYAQSYTYFNGMGDEEEGIGWTYTTWKWNQLYYRFENYYEDSYTDTDEYGWEQGEYVTKLWNDHNNYYTTFPEISFTEGSKELAMEGMLMKDTFQLGSSIDKLLKDQPNYVEHSYYEGGPYYAYPGGFSYFYDESTREITYILLNGDSLLNSLQDIEQILGAPLKSGYDDYNLDYYKTFHLNDYTLDIRTNESDEIISIWFFRTDV